MTEENVFSALIEPIRRAVSDEGYTIPTPIQVQAIPPIIAGRDVLGCAQTGTGKTAAFTLPLLQKLAGRSARPGGRRTRALILTPTRELALQIGDSVKTYGRHLKFQHVVIFGGVGQQPQVNALRRGPDIVVATPGRLLDLMSQGELLLDQVETFILDEADRMLDMGFIPDVRRIIAKLPKQRHSLFFSATMPPQVDALASDLLHNPVHVAINPEHPTVDRIAQKLMYVDKENKDALLIEMIESHGMDKVLIFTRTKHGADKVVKKLAASRISSAAIHGNKSQSARVAALNGFRAGKVRALVATDIAARGLDVDGISHVINYDLCEEPETYVHRIGRTARAGADGTAFSFCAARERDMLRDIERMIRQIIPVDTGHAYHSDSARNAQGADARPEPKGRFGGQPRAPRQPKQRMRMTGSYGSTRSRRRSLASRG
jgi:ATP-dependent RNA helicase RhlE